jgi:hypothetical protein
VSTLRKMAIIAVAAVALYLLLSFAYTLILGSIYV